MPHFDTKQLATCTFCPRLCRHVCPTAIGEASETLTPTHKVGLVHMWQQGTLTLDQELAEVFYACTDCGACTANCKHKARPAESLYQARQVAVMQDQAPASVKQVIEQYHTHGNPYGPVSVPELEPALQTKQANVQFLPGCASLYHRPDTIPLLLQALQKTQPQPIALCDPENCCGAALYATGAHALHAQHARQFLHQHRDVTSLVVGDPHCARHIKVRYPQMGLELPFHVIHLLHALDSLPIDHIEPSHDAVFYHDASPLGRHSGIYELPRSLLRKLHYQVLEFTRNRFLALDSAAGGIYRWTSPEGARRNARWLLNEIRQYAQVHHLDTPPALVTVGETERSLLADANPDLQILDLHVMLAQASE